MSYFSPRDLTEALDILADGPGQIVAGGTDVYPGMQQGQAFDYFLDVTRIDRLNAISHRHEGIHFGAGVTWSDVMRADLPPAFDALKQAAREVGSIQIQNAGTVVGNICNASPAADGVPALLTLDASVEIASAARGKRTVALADFIIGVRRTVLAADEMVTGILIPHQNPLARSAFEKLGSRRYLVISISMVAANVSLDGTGRIAQAQVAVGACSAVAQRLTDLEAALVGQSPLSVEISDAHLAPLSPIDDVRGSAAYRLDVVRAQCQRAILRAWSL